MCTLQHLYVYPWMFPVFLPIRSSHAGISERSDCSVNQTTERQGGGSRAQCREETKGCSLGGKIVSVKHMCNYIIIYESLRANVYFKACGLWAKQYSCMFVCLILAFVVISQKTYWVTLYITGIYKYLGIMNGG